MPETCSSRASRSVRAAAISSAMRAACWASSDPASVGVTPAGERWSRLWPTRSSSLVMRRVIVEWSRPV